MAHRSPSYDVCIVCALPEEARALLAVVKPACEDGLQEHISPRSGYTSRSGTLKNDKGEPVTLHISWLPRYGPQEMTLHLSRVLEECHPCIAIMTGICAGDAQRVRLGDLVVAERTFTYDNGKFEADEQSQIFHLHDTLTYQLDAHLLQFLGLFDTWMPLVADLETPGPTPDQRPPVCHIKAMASGSAVRADNPFHDVQAPVRGTVAIDMEGAAFGMVMSRFPLVRWLVVKGVSDYADQTKSDAYHDYAARASACYALRFIQAYVTAERLPRPGRSSPSGWEEPHAVWNVPYLRNPHFTGREELLDQLELHFSAADPAEMDGTRRVALTQTQAIKGPGGIGKTQIAVEYAYRSRDRDRSIHILWVNAASAETIVASFVSIARSFPVCAVNNEEDQQKIIAAMKHWLEHCQQRWLLILDNADELLDIQDVLPRWGNGHILLTTRAHAVGSLATSLIVGTMGLIEGTHLLLRRAQRFENASDEEINQASNIVVTLDHFPLALDQAGAYIEETQCGFADYLQRYQERRQALLSRRGMQFTSYPDTVATTWLLSLQKVRQANPAAAELLQLCAFLAPDSMPEELIKEGAVHWNARLRLAARHPPAFDQMITELLKFSLIERLVETRALRIHRLVQIIQIDLMSLRKQRHRARRVINAVENVFPHDSMQANASSQCLRYLDQAQACSTLMKRYTLSSLQALQILNRTGLYLIQHAIYPIARALLLQGLAMSKQLYGGRSPIVASFLNNLALLSSHQGRYLEAELLYQQALTIQKRRSPASLAMTLNNLADLSQMQGKYREAEAIYQRVLLLREKEGGPGHPDTATSLNNLALLYEKQGKYAQAEPLSLRALTIHEHLLGANHPTVATNLTNLAFLYKSQNKNAAAVEALFQRALAITEQALGKDHPDTASSLNNLAYWYLEQEKNEQAEPLLRQALAVQTASLGASHPDTARTLTNLATLLARQGQDEQAEPLLRQVLAIQTASLGTSHPDRAQTLTNLAALLDRQGQNEQVEPLLQQALAINEQLLGPEHLATAASLANLAALSMNQARDAEAAAFWRRVLTIREQRLGPGHLGTAECVSSLAILCASQGHTAEAESLYLRALAIYEEQLGAEHPTTRRLHTQYASLREAMQQAEDAGS